MTYKQIKWLILILPTVTIGLWEYARHEFFLPYISMELGNWLAPFIVLLVTLLFLTKLFAMIEQGQEELNKAKALQAVLQEREKLAQELHDGIAQSLFFLNAQLLHIENKYPNNEQSMMKLKENVHRTNDYVRQAIANLRHAPEIDSRPWLQSVDSMIAELRRETELQFDTAWSIPDDDLTSKEKVELLSIIREALLNIHKHAFARHVQILAAPSNGGWLCQIIDDGVGFEPEHIDGAKQYGLKMMRDRAKTMSWAFDFKRIGNETIVEIRKGGTRHG
ncbi:sensor histidine kinase [Paenibacillus sp. strain BS8-2]